MSSCNPSSPPHQRQSSKGAWNHWKASRPSHRVKEELNMRSQGGQGTGQCHGLSMDRVPWYRHGQRGLTTNAQCRSQRGAADVSWTDPIPPSLTASTLGERNSGILSPDHFGPNLIFSQYAK